MLTSVRRENVALQNWAEIVTRKNQTTQHPVWFSYNFIKADKFPASGLNKKVWETTVRQSERDKKSGSWWANSLYFLVFFDNFYNVSFDISPVAMTESFLLLLPNSTKKTWIIIDWGQTCSTANVLNSHSKNKWHHDCLKWHGDKHIIESDPWHSVKVTLARIGIRPWLHFSHAVRKHLDTSATRPLHEVRELFHMSRIAQNQASICWPIWPGVCPLQHTAQRLQLL